MRTLYFVLLCFISSLHAETTLNLYVWGGEIPMTVIHEFEKETAIHVNMSTYDHNETMLAKIRANRQGLYDVILPSAYFVDRMKKLSLLRRLDLSQLPNLKYLNPYFTNQAYDPHNHYSVPLTWGITGIFYNSRTIKLPPLALRDLWKKRFRHQLMLLDDPRDIIGLALLKIHHSPHDTNPSSLQKAYEALLALIPNIQLFASEGIPSMLIDEDVNVGIAWNGDVFKAQQENAALRFIVPEEGAILWIDCLAIPKQAPHPQEALQFINFMLKPEVAAKIAISQGHAITNEAGKALLPDHIRLNTMIYPHEKVLQKTFIQSDLGEQALLYYNHYWQKLKLSF